MDVSKHPTFYYHADANALGGVLKQPLARIVSTPASASLAQAGGFSTTRHGRVDVDGLISVAAAHVHVSGTEHQEEGYRTAATAVAEGLNVLEVVTADRIVAQVSLLHPYGHGPVEISLVGSQFVNLRVNGRPVNPKFDGRIFGLGREQENATSRVRLTDLLKVAEAQYAEGEDLRRRMVERLGERFNLATPSTDLEKTGDALCTILQPVDVEAPAQSYGHVIHVPGLGNIILGEICLNRFAAGLTMVRIEMGCIADGTLSVCSAAPNGRWMP